MMYQGGGEGGKPENTSLGIARDRTWVEGLDTNNGINVKTGQGMQGLRRQGETGKYIY